MDLLRQSDAEAAREGTARSSETKSRDHIVVARGWGVLGEERAQESFDVFMHAGASIKAERAWIFRRFCGRHFDVIVSL